MTVIAVSASYGAGGSVIAPLLAQRLGVPFLNRPMSAGDAASLQPQLTEDAHEDDLRRSIWGRVLEAFAAVPDDTGTAPPVVRDGGTVHRVRTEAERRLHDFEAAGGGVVLGWAAAVVLEGSYRIRLDGPPERRVRQAMRIEGLDEDAARSRREKTDEIRRVYWRRLYGLDWRDPSLYHLVVDSTAHDAETVVDAVARLAAARTG